MYSIARATKPFIEEGGCQNPPMLAEPASPTTPLAVDTGDSHERPSDHAIDHSAHASSSWSRIWENTRFPRAELSAACDGTSACMSTRGGASYGRPEESPTP